jgi:hypothetical protein
MAFTYLAQYVNYGNGSSTGYYALTQWATGAARAVGDLRRQLATPAVGSERIFICIVAGNTHASTEPTWSVSKGAKTTDNTVTWQEVTGEPSVNGDATNTVAWLTIKNTSVSLGQIIRNGSSTHYFICTTAGTAGNGSEPSWNTTTGNTTTDNGVTWTCIGAVGTFSGWGAPHARYANACSNLSSSAAVGCTVYVSHAHAETQNSNPSPNGHGSMASPGKVLCVNSAGSVPPVSADLRTTATISTTSGASFTFNCNSNFVYFYGITFDIGGSASAATVNVVLGTAASGCLVFDSCLMKISATGAFSSFLMPNPVNDFYIEFRNTPVSFANANDSMNIYSAHFRWLNTTSALQGTVPTKLFQWGGGGWAGFVECIGVDFSAAGAGKTLVDTGPSSFRRASFLDCKLNASVTKVAANQPIGLEVDFWRSGSSGVNYNVNSSRHNGTLDEEVTIVRTGGATDGTTPIAWKIVTNAGANFFKPFVSLPIAIWNDTVGSPVTATIEGIWGGGAVPNNDDIWIEAEYLGASGSPLGSFITDAKADVLAAAAGHTTSSVTWGGSTTKFKMAVTFTPQQKGWVLLRVKAAKASSTFYIDPKVVLT